MTTATATKTSPSKVLADFAKFQGLVPADLPPREAWPIGELIADCALQAGINYNAIVLPRIKRIRALFPGIDTLAELKSVTANGKKTGHFLDWTHDEKINRFNSIVEFFDAEKINDTAKLKKAFADEAFVKRLSKVRGIGPKTRDYMAILSGIDTMAIDIHLKNFAHEAGVRFDGYDHLKRILSEAAGILEIQPTQFDLWIWDWSEGGAYKEKDVCKSKREADSNAFTYKRVLLKISGESLMGKQSYGIDPDMVARVAGEVQSAQEQGAEICLVIGGGNIYRGMAATATGMDRATGDYMGMLATVMNALAMQDALEKRGVPTRVQSALPIDAVCEPYIRRRAHRHMEKGRVVIFAGGTGNPFFTTDTAAALRANEMNCDAIMKGTRVDGVYSADPEKDEGAEHFARLTHHDVLARDLKVMDASAISLARENGIPIIVFSIAEQGGFEDTLKGKGTFTLIADN